MPKTDVDQPVRDSQAHASGIVGRSHSIRIHGRPQDACLLAPVSFSIDNLPRPTVNAHSSGARPKCVCLRAGLVVRHVGVQAVALRAIMKDAGFSQDYFAIVMLGTPLRDTSVTVIWKSW